MRRNASVLKTLLSAFLSLSGLLFPSMLGCGGKGTPPATVGVTITAPSASSIDPGDSVTLTATASNSSAGVTWTLSGTGCSGAGCGVLSAATTASVTYTAPGSPSNGFTATITATSVTDTTKTATVNLTVVVAPSLSTAAGALTGGTVGTPYSVTLPASGGIAPYAWSLTNGSLPAGLTLSSTTGTISGTPTAAGSPSFTITLTDSGSPALTSSAVYTIGIASPPAIVFGTPSLPNGTVGTAYTGSVSATGGAGALTYTIAGGSLPAGLSLNTSTGAITGNPTGNGTSTFTVKATDAYGDTGTSGSYSITTAYPTLSITTSSLPAATAGASYSTTLAASGGSGTGYTWSVTSGGTALAALGLNLSSGGVLSGATPVYGTANIAVKVTDSASDTATANLSVTVNYPALSITTATTLPAGIVGGVYTAQLAASGGSGSGYMYSVASGTALSTAGLSLSSSGAITGTLTTAETAATVTIKVTDSAGNTASQTFTITVYPAVGVSSATLPNGTFGTAYSASLTGSGGSGSGYSFSFVSGTGLSAVGLSLSSSGAITGTPTGVESAGTFTVKVTDSLGYTANVVITLTVVYPALSVTTSTLANGSAGVAYSQQLAASGGSGSGYTWGVTSGASSLSAVGLSVSTAGVVSASSPTQGTATFTVKVTDSANNTATANLSVTIYAGLTVTTTTLPSADAGTAYSQTLAAAGGTGSGYTWSVTSGQSSLTATGLSVSSAGVVSATSLIAGTATFTVKVTDSANNTATQALTVAVNPVLSITTTTLPSGTVGVAYAQTLAAGGGGGGYTWSVTSGASSLSAVGLSVSSGGVVSATSPTQGTASFTVKVTDSTGTSTTQNYSVTIYAALSITTNSLPSGTVNVAYSQGFTASGGTGTGYTWSLTSGQSSLNSLGLSLSSAGVVSGSGPSYGTANFGVKVTDSANNTASGTFSVTINYGTLSISTTTIQTATVSSAYSQGFAASGGSGSYTWSLLSGQTALNNDGLSFSTGGTLSGTPSLGGSIPFVVQVKDTVTNNTASQSYSLTINAAAANYTVSGTIFSAANCGGTVQGATVSINTNPVITATTNSNGSFTLQNVPAGNWTITPSYPGASAVFFPATQAVTVSSNTASQSFGALVTFTVSGTVSYSGSKTGPIYLQATNNTCSGNGEQGTSISAPGPYTIHGVGAPGTYTINAFMDTQGFGQLNAANPTGSASVTTGYANSTNVNLTLADPGAVTLSSAPSIDQVAPINNGAILIYEPIKNSNGTEQATGYTLQWSTSSSFSSVAGSKNFAANGTNNNVFFFNGLTNGSVYYFRLQGTTTSSTSPYSVVKGPVTIGAATGGNTVSGSVTFPGTATGPLYVVLYSSTLGAYGEFFSAPSSPQAYTIQVPSGAYQLVAVLDQNHDNLVDAGDLQDLIGSGNNAGTTVTIGGNTTGQNVTLSGAGATALVSTQALYAPSNTVPNSYSLQFAVAESSKLPVSVQLASGPNVVTPMDIAVCTSGKNSDCSNGFKIGVNTYSTSPSVGDTYTFNVTYSDGTTGTVTAQVSAVLNAFATNLSPTTGTSTSTTPTFTWTDPANASNYTYQFYLNSQSNGTIWEIPGEDSSLDGFASSITSIPWNTDPTGGGSLPSVGSLSTSTVYVWQVNVVDSNNNQAITQVQYQP